MFTSFIRGKNSHKALEIGMVNVWPEILEILDDLLSEWEVIGENDGRDDTYYINICKRFIIHGEIVTLSHNINTEENTLWIQKTSKNTHGNPDIKVKSETFHLAEINGSKLDVASNIANQIRELEKTFLF